MVTAPDACPVVAPDDWAVVLTDWASAADCDASSAARVAPPKRNIPIMPTRIASIGTHKGAFRCRCISHPFSRENFRYRDVKVLIQPGWKSGDLNISYLGGLYYFIIKNEKCNSNTKNPARIDGI